MARKYIPEPFRIKMVERIKVLNRSEREEAIKKAHYNLFNLRSEDVYIDLLTDSGTNAMSSEQWAGLMNADEAYAGARSYYRLMEAGKDIFGYNYLQPVHQGRAAEKVLFPLLLGKGKYAVANTFFDTTRAHVELTGARAIDCVICEAKDPTLRLPFKGNMDTERLQELLEKYSGKIGLIVMTITNNSAGGQPVSMENIRETARIARKYGVPFCLDAARFSENAYFIKQRETAYAKHSLKDIVREMFGYADMFIMSAKKDALVNIGGLIGIKEDAKLEQEVKTNTISYEGFISYGGLSGRDLEAIAIGLYEGLEDAYLKYRIGQIEYLASGLDEAGIIYQAPAGGHGIFLDAKAMFPHIPYYQFPAQALAVELYKEAGIRSCDIGSFMLGNDPDTKEQLEANFEFTRLAIPRRVYTQAHFDLILEALINIKKRAASIKGYRITWEPEILRHFQAQLEPLA
jgi:tryptophanase